MSHARRLATANRILRLYVATSEPSDNLISIVYFTTKVYAPSWFGIKSNSVSQDRALNLFKTYSFITKMQQTG